MSTPTMSAQDYLAQLRLSFEKATETGTVAEFFQALDRFAVELPALYSLMARHQRKDSRHELSHR